MNTWSKVKPYAIALTCSVLGVLVGAVFMYQLFIHAMNPTDSLVEYVAIHTVPLKQVHSNQEADDPAVKTLWSSAQTYVGIAGLSYDQLSPRAQKRLVGYVAQIDKVAPYFTSNDQQGILGAERSKLQRDCILHAEANAQFDVAGCVRQSQRRSLAAK